MILTQIIIFLALAKLNYCFGIALKEYMHTKVWEAMY